MIPPEIIHELRNRSDIVKVVGRHVELKRKGQNHFGLCPFHAEKSPSFSVHAGKQIYHCFGCGETGDVFDFLTRIEGRSFAEIARALANEHGLILPEVHRSPDDQRRDRERQSERERALALNDRVARFYRDQLLSPAGAKAREYITRRGIGDEISDRFRLGYATEGWDGLLRTLSAEKISLPFAERFGLIIPRRDGSGHYDRFRGRIIFPLIGAASEVIGFGGRILEDKPDEPKYINTPETPVYHKGEALYGLHAARRAMSHAGDALIVEGNFDVLALHEAGMQHAIAPMGTALTERQALMLKRFARRVIAMFDGDAAGRAAARKTVPLLLAADLDAKIAVLPAGEDPDSLVRKHGREAVEKCIRTSLPAVDHVLNEVLGETERTIPGRVRALEAIVPIVAQVANPTERDLYAAKVSQALEIEAARVRAAIREAAAKAAASGKPRGPEISAAAGAGRPGAPPAAPPAPTAPTSAPAPGVTKGASTTTTPSAMPPTMNEEPRPELLRLVGLLADKPSLATRIQAEGVLGLVEHDGIRQVLAQLCDMQARGRIDWGTLVQEAPEGIRVNIEHEVFAGGFAECDDANRALDECVAKLRGERMAREVEDLRHQATKAAAQGEDTQAREFTLRAMELDRQRRALSLIERR